MKKDFISGLKLGGGIIVYNDFDVQEDVPFEKQKYSFKEDMAQISFGNRFILDIGWLPDFDPNGEFVVYIILDQDWMNPLKTIKCSSMDQLKKEIEKAVLFIEQMRKKNPPLRKIEYEEYD